MSQWGAREQSQDDRDANEQRLRGDARDIAERCIQLGQAPDVWLIREHMNFTRTNATTKLLLRMVCDLLLASDSPQLAGPQPPSQPVVASGASGSAAPAVASASASAVVHYTPQEASQWSVEQSRQALLPHATAIAAMCRERQVEADNWIIREHMGFAKTNNTVRTLLHADGAARHVAGCRRATACFAGSSTQSCRALAVFWLHSRALASK